MASFRMILIYFTIYLISIQICLPYVIPGKVIYNHRMNYDMVKNRTTNIDAVLEQVKLIIEKEHLKDYIVILGDSVAYSSPGSSNSSLAYYLNEMAKKEGKHFLVLNLAMPAMQTGDIYTMLLKMKQHGISNDHVIINVTYAGFVKRAPSPPSRLLASTTAKKNGYRRL